MTKPLKILPLALACLAMPIMAQTPQSHEGETPTQSVEQGECRPQRTPEEEASKMTERLQRELSLSDQQRDAVYQIHLKYAQLRRISNTRQEALERMNNMTNELLAVMTKQQRELFLNQQIDLEPRRKQSSRIQN